MTTEIITKKLKPHAPFTTLEPHCFHITKEKGIDMNASRLAAIGGMRQIHSDETRMTRAIDELRAMNIRQRAPCHCTGRPAVVRMWDEFPGKCRPSFIGTTLFVEVSR